MSQAIERNPGGVERLASRLNNVTPDVRDQFVRVSLASAKTAAFRPAGPVDASGLTSNNTGILPATRVAVGGGQAVANAEAESSSTNLSECFPVMGIAPRRHVEGELQRPCQETCPPVPRPVLAAQPVARKLLEKRLKFRRPPCRWGDRESKSYRGVKANSATKLQSTRGGGTPLPPRKKLEFEHSSVEVGHARTIARRPQRPETTPAKAKIGTVPNQWPRRRTFHPRDSRQRIRLRSL